MTGTQRLSLGRRGQRRRPTHRLGGVAPARSGKRSTNAAQVAPTGATTANSHGLRCASDGSAVSTATRVSGPRWATGSSNRYARKAFVPTVSTTS